MMKIINIPQRSTEWHQWRRSGIGSSDICVLMGVNPYKTPLEVHAEKIGIEDAPKANEAIKRGVKYESEALSWCNAILGVALVPVCVELEESPWMKASIDGYSKERDFLVEIKVPMKKNFDQQCREVNPMHYCQIQWHMLVSGVENAYLCIYSPDNEIGVLKQIDPDYGYQEKMKKTANEFWKEING